MKQKLNQAAHQRRRGQMGAVTALLLALIGGLIVAIFHSNTVTVVADAAANATENTSVGSADDPVSGGAEALLDEYALIYTAAGLIGFFVLIMGAAT